MEHIFTCRKVQKLKNYKKTFGHLFNKRRKEKKEGKKKENQENFGRSRNFKLTRYNSK